MIPAPQLDDMAHRWAVHVTVSHGARIRTFLRSSDLMRYLHEFHPVSGIIEDGHEWPARDIHALNCKLCAENGITSFRRQFHTLDRYAWFKFKELVGVPEHAPKPTDKIPAVSPCPDSGREDRGASQPRPQRSERKRTGQSRVSRLRHRAPAGLLRGTRGASPISDREPEARGEPRAGKD